MLASFLQDLRYALRGLSRTPFVAATLLLTIGVGTGANAMVFSLVDALLFRGPAGVVRPSQLVSVFTVQYSGQPYGHSSYPDFLSLKSGTSAFATLDAIDESGSGAVKIGAVNQTLRLSTVSSGLFAALGLTPWRGELITPDNAASTPRPAVIAHRYWRYTNDRERLIGRTLIVQGVEYTIVGVAPPGFSGLSRTRATDVWIPLDESTASGDRGNRRLTIVGRLAPGTGLDEANRQVEAVGVRLAEEHPQTNRGTIGDDHAARAMSTLAYSHLEPETRARMKLISLLLFGATGMVLLSACASAGGLLISRGASRAREIGARYAMGATRKRLVRQMLTETLVVSLGGGALGVLFASWTASVIPSFLAPEQVEMLDLRLDAGIFLFTFAIALVAGALFGLTPAIVTTRSVVMLAMRSDPGSAPGAEGGARVRGFLVVTQIAVSIVLLLATLQLAGSLNQALASEMSATARQVAVALVTLPGRYVDQTRSSEYIYSAVMNVRGLPGVEAAAWISTLPLGRAAERGFRIEHQRTGTSEHAELPTSIVSLGYFETMKIGVLEGRLFDERDGYRAPPVAIVNDVLATRYFGTVDEALGRTLVMSDPVGAAPKPPTTGVGIERPDKFTIVGVVEADRYRTLQPPPGPMIYTPIAQSFVASLNLVARVSGDPAILLDRIRNTLENVDKRTDIRRVTTLDSRLSESLMIERLITVLVAACGVLTLALALIGVYSVMADAVRRRTRELGVRMALGARPAQIVTLVFGEGAKLAGGGVAAGVIGAIVGGLGLRAVIEELPPLDPAALVAIPLLLVALVTLASVVPVGRALRVNPTVALRDE